MISKIFELLEDREALEFRRSSLVADEGLEIVLFKQFPPSHKTYYQTETLSLNQLDSLRYEDEEFAKKLINEMRKQIKNTKEEENNVSNQKSI